MVQNHLGFITLSKFYCGWDLNRAYSPDCMHSFSPKRNLPPKSYLPDANDGPIENDTDVSRSQTSVDNLEQFIVNSTI